MYRNDSGYTSLLLYCFVACKPNSSQNIRVGYQNDNIFTEYSQCV